jgi:hypothetical protein
LQSGSYCDKDYGENAKEEAFLPNPVTQNFIA